MSKVDETAPERIWLYVKQWLNSGDEEIRWSARFMLDGVEYVRADIAEQQLKQIEALKETLNAAIECCKDLHKKALTGQ